MPPDLSRSPEEHPEETPQPNPPVTPAAQASESGGAGPSPRLPPGWSASAQEAGASAEAVAPPVERPRWGPRIRHAARELIETVILALLIFLAVRAVVQNFRVEGSSMNPGLEDGQYLLINKALYFQINLETISKFLPFIDPGDNPMRHIFRAPRRGDVVVFRAPNNPERDFIKRIIGEPGDTVRIDNGIVFVNEVALEEPYVMNRGSSSYGPETVPPGQYFVLGDNRANSYDSRAGWMLPEENIIGQAWISYWPFSAWGFVANRNIEVEAP
jgi:signal peptidase I